MTGGKRRISWIHLSDLHVDRRGACDARFDRDQERCIEALEQDIGKLREELSEDEVPDALDFIFLSGDVVKRGSDPRLFEHARECLERCCEAAGIPDGRVFAIPGNHDIDRDRLGAGHGTELDFSKANSSELRQAVDLLWDSPQKVSEINEKFVPFREFAAHYAEVEWRAMSSWRSVVDIDGLEVELIGLNSVWTGGANHLDRAGAPVVGRPQRESIDEIGDGAERLTVVLQHNPTYYLHAADSFQHAKWLDERDAIVLCGHMHQSELGERRSITGRHLELTGGALYVGYEHHRRYSMGRIALGEGQRRFAVALRAADADSGVFVPDLHRYPAAPDGIAKFSQELETPNLGQRIEHRDQLEIEAERASLRFEDDCYHIRIEKRYRNPTARPWYEVEARILANALPDEPLRSRALYREHPLELDDIGFSATCDGSPAEWTVLHDHDSSKDLLIAVGDPADESSGIQPDEAVTVAYGFEIDRPFWGPYFERNIRRITRSIEVELDFPEGVLEGMSLVRNPLNDPYLMDDEIQHECDRGRDVYRWQHVDPRFQSRYRFAWRFSDENGQSCNGGREREP